MIRCLLLLLILADWLPAQTITRTVPVNSLVLESFVVPHGAAVKVDFRSPFEVDYHKHDLIDGTSAVFFVANIPSVTRYEFTIETLGCDGQIPVWGETRYLILIGDPEDPVDPDPVDPDPVDPVDPPTPDPGFEGFRLEVYDATRIADRPVAERRKLIGNIQGVYSAIGARADMTVAEASEMLAKLNSELPRDVWTEVGTIIGTKLNSAGNSRELARQYLKESAEGIRATW